MVIPRLEKLMQRPQSEHPLKVFIRSKGIRLADLARETGISEGALCRALNGVSCSPAMAEKLDSLCRAWGVKP